MFKRFFTILLILMPMFAASAPIIEGKDYEVIKGVDSVAGNTGVAEVMEFFSYGCPWCYKLEVPVSKWVKTQGAAIHFSRVPVIFQPDWRYYAKAYYLIDSLSLGKKVHDALFNAIITDKKPMNTQQAMMEFFTQQGVDANIVESVFSNSPSIELRLKDAQSKMVQFRINAIPSFVVNNQYKTNLQMAKTEEHLFEILDYLVKKTS